MKKHVEKRGFSCFSDEMCMVLLALPYGDEDVKPNIAEKTIFFVICHVEKNKNEQH